MSPVNVRSQIATRRAWRRGLNLTGWICENCGDMGIGDGRSRCPECHVALSLPVLTIMSAGDKSDRSANNGKER